LIAFAAGCATAHVDHPVISTLGGGDQDTQIEFWHTLATKSVACNDDAFHALLLDVDGADSNADYDARVKDLKSRQWIPSGFDRPANESVTRGVFAVAMCRIAGIKGGLVMHVIGPNERYCLRELQFEDLLPASSPNQTFSGTELVGVIGRLEDYMHGNPANYPAAVMPPPPAPPVSSTIRNAQ
jgi:hypothetical protein